jgi:hypothetical protein
MTASVVQWAEYLATDPEVQFNSRRYQIFQEVMGLEQGQLSLMSTIEELLRRNSSGSGLGIRHADHVAPSIHKSWH